MLTAARGAFRGLLYILVWTLVTLACGFFGLWWPVSDVSEPGPGVGFAVLLHGMHGLCLGAGIGLIAVGGLAKVFSTRS